MGMRIIAAVAEGQEKVVGKTPHLHLVSCETSWSSTGEISAAFYFDVFLWSQSVEKSIDPGSSAGIAIDQNVQSENNGASRCRLSRIEVPVINAVSP